LVNATFVVLPGRQPLVYNLCINKIQTTELNSFAMKRNKLMMVVFALSIVLHLFVFVKIKFHKQKQQGFINAISYGDHIKHFGISFIDRQALSNFGTSTISVFLSLSVAAIPTIGNEMNPADLNIFPFYLFVYFNHFISTNLITFITAMLYYFRHQALRKTIIKELKSRICSITN
jgi:hypothetical protein